MAALGGQHIVRIADDDLMAELQLWVHRSCGVPRGGERLAGAVQHDVPVPITWPDLTYRAIDGPREGRDQSQRQPSAVRLGRTPQDGPGGVVRTVDTHDDRPVGALSVHDILPTMFPG